MLEKEGDDGECPMDGIFQDTDCKSEDMSETPMSSCKTQDQVIEDIMEMIAGYHICMDKETQGLISPESKQKPYSLMHNLLGMLLTIVDSAIDEGSKRDAVKSLVRQAVNDKKQKIVQDLFDRYRDYTILKG